MKQGITDGTMKLFPSFSLTVACSQILELRCSREASNNECRVLEGLESAPCKSFAKDAEHI